MNDFDSLFPNFAKQCAEMNSVLLPVAFVLLVIGIVSSTITGQRSPGAYLRTFGRTFAFLVVLSQLTVWGNQVSSIVDKTVKTTLARQFFDARRVLVVGSSVAQFAQHHAHDSNVVF